MYRHKLPPGFVLKSELEAQRLLDEENKVDMEESIDEEATCFAPLTTMLTPFGIF
jgi:hypothetical protein